jgi:hypothetical protein
LDLRRGEHRTHARSPGGVSDPGGEVADDQNDPVSGVLEFAQLAQQDRVTEVNVGRGRVDPELHPQRSVLLARGPKLLRQRPRRQDVDGVARQPAGQLGILGGRVGGPRHGGQC